MRFEIMRDIRYFVYNCLPELEINTECRNCGFLDEIMNVDVKDINPAGCNTVCQLCSCFDRHEEKYMFGIDLLCLRDVIYNFNQVTFEKVNNWFDLNNVYTILKADIEEDLKESVRSKLVCNLHKPIDEVLGLVPKKLQKIVVEIIEGIVMGGIDMRNKGSDKQLTELIEHKILQSGLYYENSQFEEVKEMVSFIHDIIMHLI